MNLYEVSPDHHLGGTKNVFPFRFRVLCACGWTTKAHWSPDKAANAFFQHQAETGTEVQDA